MQNFRTGKLCKTANNDSKKQLALESPLESAHAQELQCIERARTLELKEGKEAPVLDENAETIKRKAL